MHGVSAMKRIACLMMLLSFMLASCGSEPTEGIVLVDGNESGATIDTEEGSSSETESTSEAHLTSQITKPSIELPDDVFDE